MYTIAWIYHDNKFTCRLFLRKSRDPSAPAPAPESVSWRIPVQIQCLNKCTKTSNKPEFYLRKHIQRSRVRRSRDGGNISCLTCREITYRNCNFCCFWNTLKNSTSAATQWINITATSLRIDIQSTSSPLLALDCYKLLVGHV